MSLRTKILLILSIVVVGYSASDHLIQRLTVSRGFQSLENAEAQGGVVRLKAALENELEHLDAQCADWAARVDVQAMASGASLEFADRNLTRSGLETAGIDLVGFCDRSGRVLWRVDNEPGSTRLVHEIDEPAATGSPAGGRPGFLPEVGAELPEVLLFGALPENRARGLFVPVKGFVDAPRGPLLVSSRKIRAGEGGATLGKLVLGRYLSEALREDLRERSAVDAFDIWFHRADEADAGLVEYVESRSAEPLIRAESEEMLSVHDRLSSELEPRPLIVRAHVPRYISRTGATAIRYALLSTLAAGMLMLLVLQGILQKIVLRPISELTHNAEKIGRDEHATIEFPLEREDEIGSLAREFADMLEKLAASRAAVVETARAAGMSEIATGILHNVGNVLNSVNVSTNLVVQRARELGVGDLESLNAIIAEHAHDLAGFLRDDPRGEHFQPFLAAVTQSISEGRAGLVEELGSLAQGVEHIRELISSQQTYASRSQLVEPVDLAAQLEQALRITEQAVGHAGELEVVREFEPLPKVKADRHKLLEILVNLVQNARQASAEAGTSAELTLRIARAENGHARIEVQDQGVGIAPENLAKIFNHGFTTKKDGHGFGLHAAANAATELGGHLGARSDGPGTGATFVLEIPAELEPTTSEMP